MSKFIFIADAFLDDCPYGGAELCNSVAIKELEKHGHEVEQIHSFFITPQFILFNRGVKFIVGNFINLSEESKKELQDSATYFIYEHDWKMIRARNPAAYPNYRAPKRDLINQDFYFGAKKVVFQSKRHLDIARGQFGQENQPNFVAVPTNLWSDEQLEILEKHIDTPKCYDCAILQSTIEHKNTTGAKIYCKENKIEFVEIPELPYKEFIATFAQGKRFVFFPKTLETLSRTSIEAQILGLEVIGNENISFFYEDYAKLIGKDLLNYLRDKREDVVKIFEE